MDLEPPSLTLLALDTKLIFGFIGIFILLFFCAIVAGAEVAFFSLTQTDLDTVSREHPVKFQIISGLIEKPKKLLATLLVANNFINIGIVILFSFIGENLFVFIASPILKFIVEVILVSFLILLFGEVLPKIYANRNNIKFAEMIATPVTVLNRLLTPISWLMLSASIYLQDKLGKQKSNFSVDQLSQALVLTSTEETTTEEQKILEGIVSFGKTDVNQIMSPRIDIFALEINDPFKKVLAEVVGKGFSRIPVYKDNIDHIEGFLFVKDLLPYIDVVDFEWQTLLKEPFFVPENKKLDNLLKDFQKMKRHLAIVVDEYGGTSGLVTLEDILEEIVGDISDEFDEHSLNYIKIDENNFLFEGKTYLKDFYRIVDVDETVFENRKGEAETLAGLILEILRNFPQKGQVIEFENYLFTIESLDKKRIKQIRVTLR